MKLDIKVDDKEIKRFLRGVPKKIPWALANAMNATILRVYNAERREMMRVFDRPTPWILGKPGKPGGSGGMAIRYAKARAPKQECFIRFRGRWDAKNPTASAEDIMMVHINGGTRKQKRGEAALEASGKMGPGNKFYVPGSGQRLNKFGNIARGRMTKLMSATRTHRDVGSRENAAAGTRQKFFIQTINGKRGIWERRAKGPPKLVLLFTGKAHYKKRFDYFRVAEKTTARWAEHNTTKAIQSELRKMRFSNVGSNRIR